MENLKSEDEFNNIFCALNSNLKPKVVARLATSIEKDSEAKKDISQLYDLKNALYALTESDDYISATKKVLESLELQPNLSALNGLIHLAADNFAVETVKALLKYGIPADEYEYIKVPGAEYKKTPLYKSCTIPYRIDDTGLIPKRIAIVQALLENKADANALNGADQVGYSTQTALFRLLVTECRLNPQILAHRKSIIDLLVKAGLDIEIRNSINQNCC